MHVSIHYSAQANEYAILNNYNVLIGENKHQKYKKLIQKTNKQDVQKILLMQESFRHILLLLLEEAFAYNLLQLNINLHEDEFKILNTEDKDITETLKCI
ncbi:hypothetical protein CIHG_10505 [Coccidioides immitis H538.4]|uniref:Uncharacterized protein n=1 Tax=Coccidioides immitis H538.4 TaxID=396776 RepID=A0A0J8S8K1_COCIT|nr:hypothetical protein CIHG_10505 [Coccidioides immitis H538.4]